VLFRLIASAVERLPEPNELRRPYGVTREEKALRSSSLRVQLLGRVLFGRLVLSNHRALSSRVVLKETQAVVMALRLIG